MTLNDLVGFQLVDLNEDIMTVKKDGKTYTLEFECDSGDYCGFAEVTNTLLYDKSDTKRNPVITKIKRECGSDKDDDYWDDFYSDSVSVTFFGESAPIANIEATAGSGSGWHYGAAVTVVCSPLQLEEEIVSW